MTVIAINSKGKVNTKYSSQSVVNPAKISTNFSGHTTESSKAGYGNENEVKKHKQKPLMKGAGELLFKDGQAYILISPDRPEFTEAQKDANRSAMQKGLESLNLEFRPVAGYWEQEEELVFVVEIGETPEWDNKIYAIQKLAVNFLQDAVLFVDSESIAFLYSFDYDAITKKGDIVSDIKVLGTMCLSDDANPKCAYDGYTYDVINKRTWVIK